MSRLLEHDRTGLKLSILLGSRSQFINENSWHQVIEPYYFELRRRAVIDHAQDLFERVDREAREYITDPNQ